MATKKKAEVTEEVLEEELEETVAEAEPAEEDPWKQKVQVRVPRKQKGDYFYVCVNDRRFEIPADGMVHEMPQPIAEVLEATIDAENRALDFAEGIPNKQ